MNIVNYIVVTLRSGIVNVTERGIFFIPLYHLYYLHFLTINILFFNTKPNQII